MTFINILKCSNIYFLFSLYITSEQCHILPTEKFDLVFFFNEFTEYINKYFVLNILKIQFLVIDLNITNKTQLSCVLFFNISVKKYFPHDK